MHLCMHCMSGNILHADLIVLDERNTLGVLYMYSHIYYVYVGSIH